jgi:4-hydroxybenzoate polyprenyltransferase
MSLPQALRLIRPKQWIKNSFVFAPVIFSKELFEPAALLLSLEAFVGFCLTASCVYVINDLSDVEADRAHPQKKNRPLASGALTRGQAFMILGVFILAAVLVSWSMPQRFQLAVFLYFGINLLYSAKLKEIVLLDVFIVAAGFMLRVLGGAFAIEVQVSSWIVLCTLFVALFLGFAKRRGELVLSQQQGLNSERKVLARYNVTFVDQMLTIAAAGTVIAYALYTVAPRTVEIFGTDKMIYTTVFVLFGVFRYLYLIHMTDSTENPTQAITSDLPIIAISALWIVSCVVIIYAAGRI